MSKAAVDAFIDKLTWKQKEIDAETQALAREIVDSQRLTTLDEAKRWAISRIDSSRRPSQTVCSTST